MTPLDQRIALLKLCGADGPNKDGFYYLPSIQEFRVPNEMDIDDNFIRICREALFKKDVNAEHYFFFNLAIILGMMNGPVSAHDVVRMIHATPEQQAEAILRASNLWKEGE